MRAVSCRVDHRIINDLKDLAALCRRSAEKSEDEDTAAAFLKMADEIEADLTRIEARESQLIGS